MDDQQIEQEIQAKSANVAPRITSFAAIFTR